MSKTPKWDSNLTEKDLIIIALAFGFKTGPEFVEFVNNQVAKQNSSSHGLR